MDHGPAAGAAPAATAAQNPAGPAGAARAQSAAAQPPPGARTFPARRPPARPRGVVQSLIVLPLSLVQRSAWLLLRSLSVGASAVAFVGDRVLPPPVMQAARHVARALNPTLPPVAPPPAEQARLFIQDFTSRYDPVEILYLRTRPPTWQAALTCLPLRAFYYTACCSAMAARPLTSMAGTVLLRPAAACNCLFPAPASYVVLNIRGCILLYVKAPTLALPL